MGYDVECAIVRSVERAGAVVELEHAPSALDDLEAVCDWQQTTPAGTLFYGHVDDPDSGERDEWTILIRVEQVT